MNELCDTGCGALAAHTHHRKMRSQGGDDSPANLMRICWRCHNQIHQNPAWAYERGYLVKSFDDPAQVDYAVVKPAMQQLLTGGEEPWDAHADDGHTHAADDPELEECGRCKGTGRTKKKPPKEETQAEPRPKVVYGIRVPKDERENGYEVIENLMDAAAELLKQADLLKSVNRGANYYTAVYVLAHFMQTFTPEAEA